MWAPRDEDRTFGNLEKFLRVGVALDTLINQDCPRIGGFDPAGETRVGNALATIAYNPVSHVRVILNLRIWRGSYDDTATHIVAANTEYRYAMLEVENVATQGSIMQMVHYKDVELPLHGFLTGQQKMHPEFGIPGLAHEMSSGRWALCMDEPYDTGSPLKNHDQGCECAYHVFLADLNGFPAEKRTYDLLMAVWFCREGLRKALASAEVTEADPRDEIGSIPEAEYGGMLDIR